MGTIKLLNRLLLSLLLILAICEVQCAVRDLTLEDKHSLYRRTRDDRYYLNRYGASQTTDRRTLKPEANPEARDSATNTNVEKRCIRCTGYVDPYDSRDYDRDRPYYDRYDNRRGYDDRYDYRGGGGGYERDRYDTRYDNRHDNRYDSRYDRTYYDRDRWYDKPEYDRYDGRGYDRYDRGGYGDRYDRYERPGPSLHDRGIGYDNRGYDYRKSYDSRGFRPWDETARGSSGWDSAGRGYYFATGRPEPGAGAGYWGYDRGYASTYNYGGGRGDILRDPGYASRPRDPYYDQVGYRGTSYLYERNPSPNTSTRPPPTKDEPGVTDRPDSNPNKSPDNSGSG